MKLSPEYRKILIKEMSYCRNKMSEEHDPLRKTFFYSGVYGVINRVLNIEFDPQLIFMNFIFASSYNMLNNHFAQESVFELPKTFFNSLCTYLQELEVKIGNGEDTYDILEKIVNLTMLTDGNGYYLYEKGVLKIED